MFIFSIHALLGGHEHVLIDSNSFEVVLAH